MPVRMRKDKNYNPRPSNNNPRPNNPNPGGGGGGLGLIPIIISLFGKNPKLLIGVVIIGGLVWFFGGKDFLTDTATNVSNLLSTGLEMDQQKFDKMPVFEPLANNLKNPLPEQVSLLEYCPDRLNQGRQGSCVGWASSYAARTILHSRQTGDDPNAARFSPSYLYNQIALQGCQGSYLTEAMKTMKQKGDVPLSSFPYDESTCNVAPTNSDHQEAANYRITGYNRLTKGAEKYGTDMLAMKQNLAQGAPVVIGMMVGGSFMQPMQGKEVWIPSQRDYQMSGFGGHAMCVIGYDDYKEGGAFQIMNSWGPQWGQNGVAWVRYQDFEHFNREAYGLHPMGNADEPTTTEQNISFGLVMSESGAYVPLRANGSIAEGKEKMPKDVDFKAEVTNSLAANIYIFGQETDGSSYVLFPYTEKHSPYCGITGTRQFPKDYSMFLDDKGSRDYFAVVVSQEALNYNDLNAKISAAQGNTYEEKLNAALGTSRNKNVSMSVNNTVNLNYNQVKGQPVGVVIAVDK